MCWFRLCRTLVCLVLTCLVTVSFFTPFLNDPAKGRTRFVKELILDSLFKNRTFLSSTEIRILFVVSMKGVEMILSHCKRTVSVSRQCFAQYFHKHPSCSWRSIDLSHFGLLHFFWTKFVWNRNMSSLLYLILYSFNALTIFSLFIVVYFLTPSFLQILISIITFSLSNDGTIVFSPSNTSSIEHVSMSWNCFVGTFVVIVSVVSLFGVKSWLVLFIASSKKSSKVCFIHCNISSFGQPYLSANEINSFIFLCGNETCFLKNVSCSSSSSSSTILSTVHISHFFVCVLSQKNER